MRLVASDMQVDELRPQGGVPCMKEKPLRMKVSGLCSSSLIFIYIYIRPLSLDKHLNSAMLVPLKAFNARYRNSCDKN